LDPILSVHYVLEVGKCILVFFLLHEHHCTVTSGNRECIFETSGGKSKLQTKRAHEPRNVEEQWLNVEPMVHQSPIQWLSWALSPGVKSPAHEAHLSRPSSAEVNAWSYTSILTYVLMSWCLVEHRDFTLSMLRRCLPCLRNGCHVGHGHESIRHHSLT